ncbi:FecR family protein [Mycoplana ramosa]|uniref:FecR domain-containing protein n=1 Tax=Mycoplana ramosa TaxID=40837 RepID=A0ABW3Z0D3_MYCRA
MLSLHRLAILGLAMVLAGLAPALAAEPVGQAVLIRTSVTGDGMELQAQDPVHRDERIRTTRSGLGQFVFRDGSKLAVGWGSSVVIDRFVYDDQKSLKKLTISAAKGTFRWISGKSRSTAYEILTPAGTIGVRGTVFDFYVGPDGTTAMVLLSGAASFCGAGGCAQLTRRCDSVIASRSGGISNPRRADRNVLRALGNARALPFLTGDQQLSGGMQNGGCKLETAVKMKQDRPDPREPLRPQKATPPKKVDRNKPSWDRPDREKTRQDKPDFGSPGRDKPDRDRPSWDRPDREKHGIGDKPDFDRPDARVPESHCHGETSDRDGRRR